MALLIQSLKPAPWILDLHDKQREVALSDDRFKSVTTSRRAGKTILLCALGADSLHVSGPEEVTLFLARTRQIAKDLIWAKLKLLAKAHSLPWDFNDSALRIETPRGGILLVRGAEGGDPGEELDKLRGLKIRRALLDEPATYAATLRPLLTEVLEPGLGDTRGDVIIAGTPGTLCSGTWHEISTGKRSKWATFCWTIRDNPHFPNAEDFLNQVRAENAWTEDDPTYQREYLGQWVRSDDAGVYRYATGRNDTTALPNYDRREWVHTIGVDFGVNDACAWTVVASHPHERDAYIVECRKQTGLLPDQAASITQDLVTKYDPYVLVGDAGGLGKPYVEHFNQRANVSIEMVAAEKSEKRAAIELLNTELRSGRLKVLLPDAQPLIDEWQTLPWSDATQTKEHPAYANDAADSCLYARSSLSPLTPTAYRPADSSPQQVR